MLLCEFLSWTKGLQMLELSTAYTANKLTNTSLFTQVRPK
jgi:hypothetical protein